MNAAGLLAIGASLVAKIIFRVLKGLNESLLRWESRQEEYIIANRRCLGKGSEYSRISHS